MQPMNTFMEGKIQSIGMTKQICEEFFTKRYAVKLFNE